MSLPKKQKLNININPPKVGSEYLAYGMERIEKLMLDSDKKSTYLPRTILMEDIDLGVFEYLDEGRLFYVIDGKKVPVIFLDNDRWGEFSKTWKLMDEDKNVPTPYITIRRVSKAKGSRMGDKFRVAQNKAFRYLDVPIYDEGEKINLRFKIPEPTNIDITYDIRLFTKYRVDVNEFDEKMFKTFGSLQDYIFIKGNPMPIYLESTDESNTIDNVDGDRFFVGKYNLLVKGFIQDEKEFEITKTTRPPVFAFGVTDNNGRSSTSTASITTPLINITNAYYIDNNQTIGTGDTLTTMSPVLTPLDATATYTILSGSLPNNTTINSTTGEIVQTAPAPSGTYSWTVKIVGNGEYAQTLYVTCTVIVGDFNILVNIDFDVNDILRGQITNSGATGVNLIDDVGNTVTPQEITSSGNKFIVEVTKPIFVLTQAEYDAITPDANTYYLIDG